MERSLKPEEFDTAMKQMRNIQLPESGVMNALKEISSSPIVMQMQKMQADAAAIIRESESYFPNSLRVVLEMSDAAQQLRNSLSQVSSLSIVAPYIEEARRASTTITEMLREMEQFRIPNLLGDWKLPELPAIDWDAVSERHRKGAVELARKGWTIAAWMPLPDISTLAESTEGEIDEYFLKNYLGEVGEKGELEQTAKLLLESVKMEKWKNLLEEVFACIEGRKYRVCIPSLLSVLEGFTMESLHKKQNVRRSSTKVRDAVEGTKWHEQDDFIGVMWLSVVTFFQQLFAKSDFDSAAPTSINRHWVLHGRSATDWTAADALRLLNALDTLHWYFS